MSKTSEDSPMPMAGNPETTAKTTSQNSQLLIEQDASKPISEELIEDPLSSVNRLAISNEVQEDSSIGASNHTMDQIPILQNQKPVTEDLEESLSDDAKLGTILDGLSTSEESSQRSPSDSNAKNSSKSEDLNSEDSSSPEDLNSEDSSKSVDLNSEDSSKSKDSNSEDSSKSEDSDSKSEDSSKSGDSNTEESSSSEESSPNSPSDSKSEDSNAEKSPNSEDSEMEESPNSEDLPRSETDSSTDTAVERFSEDIESDSSGKENFNPNRQRRNTRMYTIHEGNESINGDEDTSSIGNVQKDPNEQKKLPETNSEFFPVISEESSKSGDNSEEIRDVSLVYADSSVPGKDNKKQIRPTQKRKVSKTVGDVDNETSSSNDNPDREIKRPRKL